MTETVFRNPSRQRLGCIFNCVSSFLATIIPLPLDPTIVGHTREQEELKADIETGNVAHAYLFAGPKHVGKMTVAKAFGMQLVANAAPEDARENAFERMKHLIHPDFLVLDWLWMDETQDDWDEIAMYSNVPQSHRAKAPKMKTDVISIDDVRAIQDRLYETGESSVRVCIIRRAERMREEAVNALLKILEEPPPGRVFILTTDSTSSILPTIVSRCRVVRFRPLPFKEMKPLVSDLPEDEAQFLLSIAQGAPGIVQELREDPEAFTAERLLQTKARSMWETQSLRERIKLLAPLSQRGGESERYLLHLSLALRGSPRYSLERSRSLIALMRGLQTNAHRDLLLRRFAMATGTQE